MMEESNDEDFRDVYCLHLYQRGRKTVFRNRRVLHEKVSE
jgi:hypothetical protein